MCVGCAYKGMAAHDAEMQVLRDKLGFDYPSVFKTMYPTGEDFSYNKAMIVGMMLYSERIQLDRILKERENA